MKKSHLMGAVCACLTVISFNAKAALIDNGNTTIDTATGLEWLDLTLTQGVSYNAIVIDGFGGYAAQGYVHATTEQLCGLFGSLGDDMSGCTAPTQTLEFALMQPNADELTMLLGVTISDEFRTGAYGIFDSGNASTTVGLGCVDAGSTGGCSFTPSTPSTTRNLLWGTTDNAITSAGNWLVKPVPISAAVWLFGSGLLGLIGLARRKKPA